MNKPFRYLLCALGVLFVSVGSAHAQRENIGDWMVMMAEDGSGDTIAGTTIDDGDKYLAVRCFAENSNCIHVLVTGATCEEGSTYPLLLNGRDGAAHIEGICSVNDGTYEYLIRPFDAIRSALNGSGMVGVALPMESGAFKAVRFSLKGSTAAIKKGEEWVLRGAGGGRSGSSTF